MRAFKKKSKNKADDVTVRTYKIKNNCEDRVSVVLSYDSSLKKYKPFIEIVTERDFREKFPKYRNIQMIQCYALNCFL